MGSLASRVRDTVFPIRTAPLRLLRYVWDSMGCVPYKRSQTLNFSLDGLGYSQFFQNTKLLSHQTLAKQKKKKNAGKYRFFHLHLLTFVIMTLIGGLIIFLIELGNTGASFVDAWFMATSAVCVTGAYLRPFNRISCHQFPMKRTNLNSVCLHRQVCRR